MRQRIYCPGCGAPLTKKYFDFMDDETSEIKYEVKCEACIGHYIVHDLSE